MGHGDVADESIIPQTVLFVITRVVLNTSYRMVYPLLPVFTRGLGVGAAAIARALTLRSIAGAFTPALGPLSDSMGRRAGMVLGLLLFSIGAALVWLIPAFPAFVATLVLMVAGKYLFEPSMQAYVGERVPYRRRGLAIAVTEFGWSLAFIAGVPACALAISRFGWSAPFPAFAVGGLVAALLHHRLIGQQSARHADFGGWLAKLRALAAFPPALSGLAAGLLATAANEVVNVVFGIWMESAFRVSLAGLGAAAMVVGTAELCGEMLAAFWSDRLGKSRCVMLGLALNSVSALAMFLLSGSVAGALTGLFIFFITYEFGIVSLLPLMTELFPGARATFMGANVAALSLGRAVGALLAIPLYSAGLWRSLSAAVLFDLCAWSVLRRIREDRATKSSSTG